MTTAKLVEWIQTFPYMQNFPFAYDDREPTYFFEFPRIGSIGVIPIDFGFWISTFALLSLQTVLNILVATLTYHFIVQKDKSTKYLIGYGVMLPTLLVTPMYLASILRIPNVCLLLCLCGAIPNLLTLRIIEAMHNQLPSYIGKDWKMLTLYFSATLQIQFDPHTQRPVPFTMQQCRDKLRRFGTVLVQTSLLLSLLIPFQYQVFPRPQTTFLATCFDWGNLANNFLLASLTSLVLDGGASGLGLMTSIATGYTLENFSDAPLTQSTSPSDFWGRRWDRPVESALRRGCFQPLRKGGFSRAGAVILTFLVSGAIHEYVLWLLSFRGSPRRISPPPQSPPQYGNQFLFFAWNALVLVVERYLEGHWILQWMQQNLPRPMRTALVLMTVLPLAHLFTDEYVHNGFYADTAWAFPIFVYLGPKH